MVCTIKKPDAVLADGTGTKHVMQKKKREKKMKQSFEKGEGAREITA